MKLKKFAGIIAFVLLFISLYVLQANATDSRYLASEWQDYLYSTASTELGFSLSPNVIGSNCFGFASLVTKKLNNVVVKAYQDYDHRELASSSGWVYGIGSLSGKGGSEVKTVIASYLGDGRYITTEDVRSAFSNAKVGDWVQMVVSRQHSAIISELYADGFEVLHSNWPSKDAPIITNKYFSYESFAQQCRDAGSAGGFTINRFGNSNEPAPSNLTFTGNTDTFADESYSASFTASGSGITYSIVNGSLPAGLTLNSSTGQITGCANNIGYTGNNDPRFMYYPVTYNFTVRASNSGGYVDKSCSINVWEAPKFSQYNLADGTLGAEYEQEIIASGTENGMWWQKTGNLPDGLKISTPIHNRIANITGIPTKPGEYTFTLKLRHQNYDLLYNTKNITKQFTINIPEPEIYCRDNDTFNEITGNLPYLYAGTAVPNLKFSIRKFSGSVNYSVEGSLPPGVSLSSAGTLTGTPSFTYTKPTQYNTYSFKVVAKCSKNSFTYTVKKDYSLTVIEKPVFSTNSTLLSGTVGQQYSTTIDVTGSGSGMEIFLKSGSSLPNGLKLEAGSNKWQKKITGTPSSSGTYKFTLTARNNLALPQTTTTKEFTIYIAPQPVININYKFKDGTVDESYSDYVTASGGTSPYTWTKTSGTLPQGLSLSWSGSTCYLKGTPTQAGTYEFYLKATDNNNYSSNPVKFTIVITKPLAINGSFENGTVGKYYSSSVSVSGGTSPYTWTLYSGSVPSESNFKFPSFPYKGATLTLSGTPQNAKTYDFTLKVTDANNKTVTKYFPVTINPAPVIAPKITTTSLPEGQVDKAYSAQIKATGTTPITYSMSGAPSGLSINSSTGYITGTPKSAGTFKVKITAKNSAGSDSKTLNLTIEPEDEDLEIKLNGPSKKLTVGESCSFYFNASGGSGSYSWSRSGSLPEGLKSSVKSNNYYIEGTPAIAGTYSFTIKFTDNKIGKSISQNFAITINPPDSPVISDTFSSATAKQKYSDSITLTGGTLPIKWQLVSGTLPPGLKLKHSGRVTTLSGTHSKAGTYEFTLKATDKNNLTVEKTFSISVSPALSLTGTLANTSIGQTYSKTLTVSGGAEPYTFSYSGKIPSGLKLTHSGSSLTLSGEPDTKGKYTFKINVTDGNGAKISKSYTVMVQAALDTKKTFTHYGIVGKSYNSSINITGGTALYSIDYNPDELPEGLKLTKSGSTLKLSGKPTQTGDYEFTVTITEKNNMAIKRTFAMNVTYAMNLTGTLPSTSIGQAYNKTLTISGGAEPYTFSYSGKIPSGLNLTHSDSSITLSGEPNKKGTYKFKINVTDKNGVKLSKSYTVTTKAALATKKVFTAYGTVGQSYNSSISITGGTLPYNVTYNKTGTIPEGLKLTKSGSTVKLAGKPTQAGTYSFELIITEKNEASLTTGAFNIEISDPLKIPDIFTNTGAIDEDYSSSVNITGGKAPYTFNKTSGSLPKGLELDLSGSKLTLSGTPGKLGKYTFTVKITDANKRTVSKKFTVKVSKAQAEEEIKQQSYSLSGKNKTSETDITNDNTLPETPENIITGTQKNALKVNLSVSSKDIISQCSGRDEDIIKVKANEPVTFEVSGFDSDKVSHEDFIIIYDFNPIEDITLDDGGTFTLPAELVSGDFTVSVSSDVEIYEYESDELYLEAVSE